LTGTARAAEIDRSNCCCNRCTVKIVSETVAAIVATTLKVAVLRHNVYAVVTCEIKLFSNNFKIISVFYFTCNHVWNGSKISSQIVAAMTAVAVFTT